MRPMGDYLAHGTAEDVRHRCNGLGPSTFATVPDEALVHTFLFLLDAATLARLSRCSRAWYCYAHAYTDVWKSLVLTSLAESECGEGSEGARLDYKGSWKATYLSLLPSHPVSFSSSTHQRQQHIPLHSLPAVYSDVLYAPYGAVARFEKVKARLLRRREKDILRLRKPTVEEFRAQCEAPNLPCVLEGVMEGWPARREWGRERGLLDRVTAEGKGDTYTLHGNGLSFTVPAYSTYAQEQQDDLPLYIFDSRFLDKCPALAQDYIPFLPPYFQQDADYFALLGTHRPDHRWLIWGPKGSGSTFHKDPNATAAWNAVLKGRKKWILFPPHIIPPGVHPSDDGLDLATPVTLTEWVEGFYSDATAEQGWRESVVEAVCEEGEIMFVPRGWWHLVVNTEESLAITQNYVSRANLPHVLSFLEEETHLVSGLPDADRPLLYSRFVEVLRRVCPKALDQAQEERLQARRVREKEEEKMKAGWTGCQRKWSAVMGITDDSYREKEEAGLGDAKHQQCRSSSRENDEKKVEQRGGPGGGEDGREGGEGGGRGFQFGFHFAVDGEK